VAAIGALGSHSACRLYALIVVSLMNGRVVLAHYAEFGSYSGAAEQLAVAAGGLIVFAANARIDAALAARRSSGPMRPGWATSRQALRS
jgi:hypothetical protein